MLLFAVLVNLLLFVMMERMVVPRSTVWEGALARLTLGVVALPDSKPSPEAKPLEPEQLEHVEAALEAPGRNRPLPSVASPKFAWLAEAETQFAIIGRPGIEALAVERPAPLETVLPDVHVKPRYPRRALARGLEGHVVVAFTIQLDGTTTDLEIVESQPAKVFDRSALEAVERWRFAPQSQPRREELPIVFELEE
jgi:protein TonB